MKYSLNVGVSQTQPEWTMGSAPNYKPWHNYFKSRCRAFSGFCQILTVKRIQEYNTLTFGEKIFFYQSESVRHKEHNQNLTCY